MSAREILKTEKALKTPKEMNKEVHSKIVSDLHFQQMYKEAMKNSKK